MARVLVRLALLAAALPAVAAGGVVQPTLVHETGWFRSGRPAPGLYVSQKLVGHCTAPARSTPRAYAWRCFAAQHFIDPCFSSTPKSATVVCPFDPWSKDVRIVKLNRRLPRWVARPQRRNVPWGIWTTNAKHCVLAVSGASLWLAGKRVRYECASSGFLVGYPDVGGREWTIGYVPRYDLGKPDLHARSVGITDVWR